MNGMHYEQHWAYNEDSDDYSTSHHFELAPTPTLAQLSMGDYYEFDDQAHVNLGFTSCQFLDSDGVTRTRTFSDIDAFAAAHAFSQDRLVRADFELRVSNCSAAYIANFFFWDSVT